MHLCCCPCFTILSTLHNLDGLAASTAPTTPLVRERRQAEVSSTEELPSSGFTELPVSSTSTEPKNEGDETLKKVFNYAEFTRTAGWQLVDQFSNHSEGEPRTLLHCQYRGKDCDSRVIE